MRTWKICVLAMTFVVMAGVCAWGDVAIDVANFPDNVFRTYVSSNFDTNSDDILSDAEIANAKRISVIRRNISSLKGVEFLTSLTYLSCYSNNMTVIDVSKNTELTHLDCCGNQLAELDVSKNTKLTFLDCDVYLHRISLASPDATGNPSYPYSINLNTLKVSRDISVDIAEFVSRVHSLDVRDASGNRVEYSTDTSAGMVYFASEPAALKYRYDVKRPNYNQYMRVTVRFGNNNYLSFSEGSYAYELRPQLTGNVSLDAEAFPDSKFMQYLADNLDTNNDGVLSAAERSISTLNVSGRGISSLKGIEHLSLLTYLDCSNNELTSLKLSAHINLQTLLCHTNHIPALDLRRNTALRRVNAGNQIILLDQAEMNGEAISGGTTYPYKLDLTILNTSFDVSMDIAEFASNVRSLDILTQTGVNASYYADISNDRLYLAANMVKINYCYNMNVNSSANSEAMDVTVTLGNINVPLELKLSPSSQTVSTNTPITEIAIMPRNANSISVSNLPSGLSQTGNTISGMISAAGTYVITCTASDLSGRSVTQNAVITVQSSSGSPATTEITDRYHDTYQDTPVVLPQPQTDTPADGNTTPISGDTAPVSGDNAPVSSDTPAPASGDSPVNPTPGGDVDPYANNGGSSWNNAISFSTAEALNSMLGRVNRGVEPQGLYYKITSNIDLSSISNWEGIGTDEYPFTGHMDGGGNTITYVNSSTALFGTVNSEGTAIQNLRVVARSANASARFTSSAAPSDTNGGIVKKLTGGTIENCSFSGNVSASGDDSSAGGIAGEVSGGTIKNCEVQQGSGVNAGYSAGGIAGYISGGEITDCTSNAEINAEYFGGIAGYSESQRSDINSNSFTQSDYEVGNDAVSLRLTPATQSVTDGSSIASITPASENISSLSFVVDGGYDLGLSVSGGSITGTIPDNTSAGTYTVTVTGIDADGIRISGQVSITVTRRPGRIYPSRGNNLLDYIFDMPAGLSQGVSAFFGGESVYQFAADEIAAESWQPDTADLRAILGTDMRAILTLPAVRPARSGVYMLKLTLADIEAGVNIGLQGITAAGDISSSALEDIEYAFFDEAGRKITTVPANKTVYAALKLSSGRTHRGVVTAPKELELGRILPIELDETLRNNIAESLKDTLKVSADALMSLTDDNISDPEEPTQAMRDEMSSRESDVVGKMNTLTVSKEGWYVLHVILSDDLYEEHIKDVSIENLRAYAIYDADKNDGQQVSSSILNGILSTFELLSMSGEKLKFGVKEFLMVGFLDAGTPFSVYLTKLLLALLMGGCDAGLGLVGLGVVAGAVILIMRRRR